MSSFVVLITQYVKHGGELVEMFKAAQILPQMGVVWGRAAPKRHAHPRVARIMPKAEC